MVVDSIQVSLGKRLFLSPFFSVNAHQSTLWILTFLFLYEFQVFGIQVSCQLFVCDRLNEIGAVAESIKSNAVEFNSFVRVQCIIL